MGVFGYGAEENKLNNANEAIGELSTNKTIMVQKLTDMEDPNPDEVKDLQTVEQVFSHYKPSIEINFKDAEGGAVAEDMAFDNLGDFGPKGMTKNSKFLAEMKENEDQNLDLVRSLKSNKAVQKVLQDPDARKALQEAINAMVAELEGAAS